MPRVGRVIVEKIPYHITQRGNRREKVFFREKDYKQYLDWLEEYSKRSGLEVYVAEKRVASPIFSYLSAA
mgnify:CR=1 FL=1